MVNKDNRRTGIIWNFVNENTNFIYFILISFLALAIRIILFKYNSGDYDMFLEHWFNDLQSYGGLPGLAQNIGNYTPIYMTILALLTYLPFSSLISIKIVSVIFDFVGAVAMYKIVKELLSGKRYKDKIALLFYGLYLFLPTVLLNSAYWSQSDGMYTAFVLISILYLLKKNYKKAIIFWSIALAFKFQAILIFPLYILIFISDSKFKFRYFLFIPVVVFIFSLPKALYSKDLLCGFKIYIDQAGTYSQYITLNFPNIYGIFFGYKEYNNLIDMPIKDMNTMGIIATFAILVTLAYLVYVKRVKFDKKAIIEFGLLSVLITTFFLPQMHEMCLFMGDVIALLYLIINSKKYYVPIMVEFISLNGYMYLLFSGFAINFSTLSIAFLVLIVLYIKDIWLKYFKYEV